MGDAQVYRDKAELLRLKETRDPIMLLRARLELGDEEWAQLETEAERVVDEALAFALAATDPEPSDALENVYAESTGTERSK